MKLKLVRIDKESAYDEWLNFRMNGLGASEIGTLMGVNSFKSPAELYYQKIGLIPQKVEPNMPMFMGTILEQTIANMYEHYDGDEQTMISNYTAGVRVRQLYEPKGYIVNDLFPHMFFSPDRLVTTKQIRARGESINLENVDSIAEIKTISGWHAKQWEGGIPPSYYLQLQTYMMGLGVPKGALVVLKDGRDFSIHEYEADEEIISNIISISENFWERVLLGRQALDAGGDYEQYAPPPDGSEAYREYLDQRFCNPEDKTIASAPEVDSQIMEYQRLTGEISELEDQRRFCSNFIKTHMGDYSLLVSDMAKVTWRPNKNGTRVFRVN
jgi:putative phage-type endonuclease